MEATKEETPTLSLDSDPSEAGAKEGGAKSNSNNPTGHDCRDRPRYGQSNASSPSATVPTNPDTQAHGMHICKHVDGAYMLNGGQYQGQRDGDTTPVGDSKNEGDSYGIEDGRLDKDRASPDTKPDTVFQVKRPRNSIIQEDSGSIHAVNVPAKFDPLQNEGGKGTVDQDVSASLSINITGGLEPSKSSDGGTDTPGSYDDALAGGMGLHRAAIIDPGDDDRNIGAGTSRAPQSSGGGTDAPGSNTDALAGGLDPHRAVVSDTGDGSRNAGAGTVTRTELSDTHGDDDPPHTGFGAGAMSQYSTNVSRGDNDTIELLDRDSPETPVAVAPASSPVMLPAGLQDVELGFMRSSASNGIGNSSTASQWRQFRVTIRKSWLHWLGFLVVVFALIPSALVSVKEGTISSGATVYAGILTGVTLLVTVAWLTGRVVLEQDIGTL